MNINSNTPTEVIQSVNSGETDEFITTKTSEKPWIAPRSENTIKPLRPLTRKQKAFVKHLIDNPKDSATQAVKTVYDINNPNNSTASTIATELMAKPEIKLELAKYSTEAENTLVDVMQYSRELGRSGSTAGASYASNAGKIADSLLDRIHGKAKITVEQHSSIVQINVDLVGNA